jgi:hypothetical protein
MALDIRLDFIRNIKPEYIEKMTMVREMFIDIDRVLKMMVDESKDAATQRSIALSRTYNEQACQAAIKSLCLLGEVHTLTPDELPGERGHGCG